VVVAWIYGDPHQEVEPGQAPEERRCEEGAEDPRLETPEDEALQEPEDPEAGHIRAERQEVEAPMTVVEWILLISFATLVFGAFAASAFLDRRRAKRIERDLRSK
jgi:hypothetical protein